MSVLRRSLLAAAAGVVLYELLLKTEFIPGLPDRALDGLNLSAGHCLDRLLAGLGLAGFATVGSTLHSVSDYALAILLLTGAALLYLLSLPAAWLLARSTTTPKSPTPQPEPAGRDSAGGEAVSDGAASFVTLLSLHGVAADAGQIMHRFGGHAVGLDDMLRLAKELGLKARVLRTKWERLAHTPLPGIAALKTGGYLLIAKADAEKALVQAPGGRPRLMTRAELEAEWDGRLLLITTRAGLLSLGRRFDLTWFLGAVWKYRHLLSEVLVASFFLQLFALVSPLFFQVVIDKVLVHRTETTLDVLVIGLVCIALFQAIMGGLRTYLFAHTTNRIDVELGARLFRHLLALPLAYFQARRVGDSVARVRELENIRTFITSSALTLVIDLLFTVVFLAVMVIYSVTLTLIVIAAFPFYIAISATATPIFRKRLDEKFQRGAENQAFLVESVTGVETLKSMAVEPQMQRRWEEQLAGYVAASFRVLSLGNVATKSVQFINRAVTALLLFFGARLVMDGSLTVGELVAFNMLASRVNTPVLRLAQIGRTSTDAESVERLGDILNTPPEPQFAPGGRRCRSSRATSPLSMSPSATGSTGRRSCPMCPSASPPARSSALSGLPAPAKARSPS